MAKEHKWGRRSKKNQEGVHPDLIKVLDRTLELCPFDLTTLEGRRTVMRQRELVDAGASWTMDSRHLTGHAADLGVLVNGELRWDWSLYYILGACAKRAGEELGIAIEWGGDWNHPKKDGPHIQLSRKEYPA